MSDLLKRLTERRANIWEQAKTHLDDVERSGDSLTGEAETKWQALNTELTGLDERIEEVRSLEERARKAEEVRTEFGAPEAPKDEAKRSDGDILAAIGRGEIRSHEFHLSERRDLTKGTATDGQELVPSSFVNTLYEHLLDESSIRQAGANVITTTSGETILVPKTTSYSSASIVAEAGSIGESDPQFAQASLGAYKYAFIVDVSSELLQDEAIGLEAFLARQGGAALGRGSNAHYVGGNGTTQPQGLVSAATVGKTGATSVAGAFTGDDLIDLYYSVIAPYRANAAWLMRDGTLAAARKLKDTNTGQYLWQPGLQAGEPGTLLGKPVFAEQNVPAVALGARSILFGDHSTYTIRDVSGVRIERSVDARWDNDLVSFRFIFRTDGDLIDTTGSVKAFAGGAS